MASASPAAWAATSATGRRWRSPGARRRAHTCCSGQGRGSPSRPGLTGQRCTRITLTGSSRAALGVVGAGFSSSGAGAFPPAPGCRFFCVPGVNGFTGSTTRLKPSPVAVPCVSAGGRVPGYPGQSAHRTGAAARLLLNNVKIQGRIDGLPAAAIPPSPGIREHGETGRNRRQLQHQGGAHPVPTVN